VAVEVVPYSEQWPVRFAEVATALSRALEGVPVVAIEHVGSTSVPGLPAKPILDVDVIVRRPHVSAAIAALVEAGYAHQGDLGLTDRECLSAPDDDPRRNVYVCVEGTLHVRNHLAVRDVLRARADLRERYGAVKTQLARRPEMDIDTYVEAKSGVLQEVLAASELSEDERATILAVNSRSSDGSGEQPP
jgi:GrpB-like predicted nucleotidyltransferase (UPF0157 family)